MNENDKAIENALIAVLAQTMLEKGLLTTKVEELEDLLGKSIVKIAELQNGMKQSLSDRTIKTPPEKIHGADGSIIL